MTSSSSDWASVGLEIKAAAIMLALRPTAPTPVQLSVSRAAAWRTAIIINQTSTVAGLGLATRCRDVAACRATGTSPV